VWLRIARKGSGQASVSNDEALDDVALCYGWINGQRKPLDGSWYLQMVATLAAGDPVR
jgi:uncharacterized protein YdeI (YjbR/CyaY-like superfamily)